MNTNRAGVDTEEPMMLQKLLRYIQGIRNAFGKVYVKNSNKAVTYPNKTVTFCVIVPTHKIVSQSVQGMKILWRYMLEWHIHCFMIVTPLPGTSLLLLTNSRTIISVIQYLNLLSNYI